MNEYCMDQGNGGPHSSKRVRLMRVKWTCVNYACLRATCHKQIEYVNQADRVRVQFSWHLHARTGIRYGFGSTMQSCVGCERIPWIAIIIGRIVASFEIGIVKVVTNAWIGFAQLSNRHIADSVA
jgi:hypothetical protein